MGVFKMDFKLVSDYQQNYGHCQITYVTRNKIYYCLQDDFQLRLMRCTQDGEPSYEVTLKEPVSFERPKITEYDSNYVVELKTKVNKWIKENCK